MNKKSSLKLAYEILLHSHQIYGKRVLEVENEVVATYKDAVDIVRRTYINTEADEEVPVLSGITSKGTIHAIRGTGTMYCFSEVQISDERFRKWGEITCKTCKKHKATRARLENL